MTEFKLQAVINGFVCCFLLIVALIGIVCFQFFEKHQLVKEKYELELMNKQLKENVFWKDKQYMRLVQRVKKEAR